MARILTVLWATWMVTGGLPADEKTAPVRSVTLRAVRARPEGYRGTRCEMDLVFHNVSRVYNPFFTRFLPETHVNFAAWGDEQPLWDPQEYLNDFPLFFLAKDNPRLRDLLALRRFDRIRAVAVVRDTFRGLPWIEILDFQPLPGKLTEKALAHRVRGDLAMSRKHPRIAATEYGRALAVRGLPRSFRVATLRALGLALFQARDYEAAARTFERLARLAPEDPHAPRLAAQARLRARNGLLPRRERSPARPPSPAKPPK